MFAEHSDKLKVNKGKHLIPPPAPMSAPPTREVSGNYGRSRNPPPPPPKPSTPVIQMIKCWDTSSCEKDKFWTLRNYEKASRPPPPAPKLPAPTHQVSGGGGAALGQSSPDLFHFSA